MSNHIMVDLETLDTAPTSIILSIGAVVVNFKENSITDPFYRVIEVDSCKLIGLTESKSTRAWWDKQSPEARKVFTDPSVPIIQGLADFAKYVRMFGSNTVKMWGCGSDFDNVILINAYKTLGSPAPWRFYNNRCYRTVRESFSHLIQIPNREGVYHNALDDAKYQASILLQLKDHINHD